MQKLGILDLEARGREVDARKRKSCTTRSRYHALVKILIKNFQKLCMARLSVDDKQQTKK